MTEFKGSTICGGRPRKARLERPNRRECAMKLTSAQVERTLGQFEARIIPDDHPVIPQLNDLFGEHTFFLDRNGLNIVEPAEAAAGAAAQSAKVVNLASWCAPKAPLAPSVVGWDKREE